MLFIKGFWPLLLALLIANVGLSQIDSTKLLDQVIIKAFAYEKPLQQVPASVAVIESKDLNRFSNTSFLPVLNTIPGVRMEERSPGSFRLAIRGSSLRSPFGIRNVKFYWNGLPMTDGGGNTYLNLLDFDAVQQIEVIKGPSGSLYGAGMGGVLLLTSPKLSANEVQLTASVGSYGLQRYQVNATGTAGNTRANINYAHQQSDGYRQQAAMRRDALNLDFQFQLNKKSILRWTNFYTDLYYQTPGGLTKAQYDQDPTQARPAAGSFLSAVQQQASVFNKTFYSGLMLDQQWNALWSTRIGFFGATSDFKNLAINNYEKRTENNWGGRMENQVHFNGLIEGTLTFGGEFQFFNSPIENYQNLQGNAGDLVFGDALKSMFALLFAQAEIELPKSFLLTLGASGNFLTYQFKRNSVTPAIEQTRNFDPVLVPRIALLKKINEQISVYGSISKGFSPPTLAEVRPSTNTYNDSLKAETGINYEIGARGKLLKNFSFEVALYSLQLNETIVVQRQISNADFFENSGGTSQLGAEIMLSYVKQIPLALIKVWSSYTRNAFMFNRYIKNQQDFSYKNLPGVAPHVLAFGIDLKTKIGLYLNTTVNYVDSIPLNDANTDFASGYLIAGSRLGYAAQLKNIPFDFWIGIDNATDQRYSLGNDLNAAGGRFYNAAPERNFFTGLRINLK